MLFWIFAYLLSLALVNLHAVSFFTKLKKKITKRDLSLFCFTLCLYLFSVSSLAIKALNAFNISHSSQIYIIALSGVPLFIAIWLAVPFELSNRLKN